MKPSQPSRAAPIPNKKGSTSFSFPTCLRAMAGNAYVRVLSMIAALLIIGLSTVDRYGISSDELAEISMVFRNLDLVKRDKPITSYARYYGTFFNFASEGIYRAGKALSTREGIDEEHASERLTSSAFYERIQNKHRLTFLLSLAAYISVAGIVTILAGVEFAWIGPLILALFPRFWGHSFFNPKDIPFAAMFTLGIFLGACLIGGFLKIERDNFAFGTARMAVYSLLYGVFCGLVTGTRIGGCFLLPFVAAAHFLTSPGFRCRPRFFLRFLSPYGLMCVGWMATTYAISPSSWSSPVGWLIDALTFHSKHVWSASVLFEGQFISAQALPWYYLPKWIAITSPVIFQILFVAGILLLVLKYKRLSPISRACFLLLVLQVGFFPSIAIIRKSTLYDGLRQFLFVLPAIAAISAAGLAAIYQKIPKNKARIIATVAFLALCTVIVVDMVKLHPYEYVYFNRQFGGLEAAQDRYETDYWGLSMREGMEWINNNAGEGALVVSTHLTSSVPFASDDKHIISYREFKQKKVPKPFYYLARSRWNHHGRFPGCGSVHQVVRQGVPLTIVKKCE